MGFKAAGSNFGATLAIDIVISNAQELLLGNEGLMQELKPITAYPEVSTSSLAFSGLPQP